MKLIVHCPVCQTNFLKTNPETIDVMIGGKPQKLIKTPDDHIVEFIVGDDNAYKITCRKGHDFYYIYPEDKFELLFRSGLSAYSDGYFREAVSSVAVSLERFYEFALRAMCHANTIEMSEFNNTWKNVKSQSERQLGSFYFLYLITTKKAAPTMSNTKIEFRNDVVHKGVFPEKEKTLNYIKDVLALIYSILDILYEFISHSINEVYNLNTQKLIAEYTKKPGHMVSSETLSIINTVLKNIDKISVDSMLTNIEFVKSKIKR